MAKLVCTGVRDRVLGAHVVGIRAGDLANEIAVGLASGASASSLAAVVNGHPTAGEAIREAAQGFLDRWGAEPTVRGAVSVHAWTSRWLTR